MSKKIFFSLCLHNHQPVGNFTEVLEKVYKQAYFPFIEILKKHPKIKLCLHYSGYLLNFLKNEHPEFIETLRQLIKKKQIEILSGGIYEPVLCLIPDEDKIGQIKKMNKLIKETFKFIPSGYWLAERVWETNFAKYLNLAKIEYTLIDDNIFKKIGLSEQETFFNFITEEDGFSLNVFPINEFVRHSIPFDAPEISISYLEKNASADDRIIIFADDGEKFGLWPGTNKWVYEQAWLEKFFKLIEENPHIETILLSSYLEKTKTRKKVYLPPSSYSEMLNWSSGFFRNFLLKYEEANNLHKKMIYVSKKVNKVNNDKAKELLYKGECNDAYWHGVFGGLYINFLRQSCYTNLLKAEQIADKDKNSLKQEIIDINSDGKEEILISNKFFNTYFIPHYGGALFELDYKPKNINLLATLHRQKENYHQEIKEKIMRNTKEEEKEKIEEYFKYDWHFRYSLLDHFFHSNTSLHSLKNCNYGEQGNFVIEPYEYKLKKFQDKIILNLAREGGVWIKDNFLKVAIKKEIILKKDKHNIEINYQVMNNSSITFPLWFGIEFNLSLSYDTLKEGELKNVQEFQVFDEKMKCRIFFNFNKETNIFYFPVKTISQSEKDFDLSYQSSVILPNWKIELEPKKIFDIKIEKSFKNE